MRFIGAAPSVRRSTAPDPGGVSRAQQGAPEPAGPVLPAVAAPASWPQPTSLSYTALATYEQCGYRFYLQRLLGLPDLPTPESPNLQGAEPSTVGVVVPAPAALSGAERGTLLHQKLAGMDLRNPSLDEPMPADVRALLARLIASSIVARLGQLRDVRREQRFAFPVGSTLITGIFDLIGQEREGHLLVIDYKSDRLAGADPEMIVRERYIVQRLIYALAALKLGAPVVEVMHLFLEAPDDPVTVTFTAADLPTLESGLGERIAGPLTGDFRVTHAPGRRICDGCPAQGGL